MASEALKRRMAKLEARIAPPEEPPFIVWLDCVNGPSRECVMAVIAGTTSRPGDTLRRGPDEAEGDFIARAEARCAELNGGLSVEVELR